MVVLDSLLTAAVNSSVNNNNNIINQNQYIQPDYLGAQITLDAKKSPLALLAQTCSQIGQDPQTSSTNVNQQTSNLTGPGNSKTTNVKSPNSTNHHHQLTSPSDNNKEKLSNNNNRKLSSTTIKSKDLSITSNNNNNNNSSKVTFKPYDITSMSKNNNSSKKSSSSSASSDGNNTPTPPIITTTTNNLSMSTNNNDSNIMTSTGLSTSSSSVNSNVSTPSPPTNNNTSSGTAHLLLPPPSLGLAPPHPTVASSLHDLSTFYSTTPSTATTTSIMSNPAAFRPIGTTLGHSPYSASYLTYPGSPYFGYARVKTPNGPEAIVTLCKDPYCASCLTATSSAATPTACGNSTAHHPLSTCHSVGCQQCQQQQQQQHQHAASNLTLNNSGGVGGAPYICSWIQSDGAYCGKRCVTSDELFCHLRAHTAQTTSFYGHFGAAAASVAQSASRFHPYAAAAQMAAAAAASLKQPASATVMPSSLTAAAAAHYFGYPQQQHPSSSSVSAAAAYNAAAAAAHQHYFGPYGVYRLGT